MLTKEFTFDIGINPGYHHKNERMEPIAAAVEAWRRAANAVETELGIYIPAVFYETCTVYKEAWGCPIQGEVTVRASGIRNPDFCSDPELWQTAVKYVCERMKLYLCQTTAYLSFRDVDFEYMK